MLFVHTFSCMRIVDSKILCGGELACSNLVCMLFFVFVFLGLLMLDFQAFSILFLVLSVLFLLAEYLLPMCISTYIYIDIYI